MARLKGGFSHGGQPEPDTGPRNLPDRRTSLVGIDPDGNEVWLVRAISQKLYRCPGCHREVAIGSEHVVVRYFRRGGGSDHHHWHAECADRLLAPTLSRLRRVSTARARRD
jgi:hypothetical protein